MSILQQRKHTVPEPMRAVVPDGRRVGGALAGWGAVTKTIIIACGPGWLVDRDRWRAPWSQQSARR